jgi:phthalate 4,5-dioxygenase oxygenase subunit
MVTAAENRLLTEVEGDAPMGRWMREHHWIPCIRSAQLAAGGRPERVRLLGEKFVAFRTHDGAVGFVNELCPHRGVSLALARNEGGALTCIFHGWRIGTDGCVLDAPSELRDPKGFAARVPFRRYPVFEGGGLVWVWLGAAAPAERPNTPFCLLPQDHCWVTRTITPCNWLQGVEGTLDSIHVGTLHKYWIGKLAAQSASKTIGLSINATPRYEAETTEYGLSAAALRDLQDGRTYTRITEYVAPFVSLVPAQGAEIADFFISVPIDNTSHMLFFGFYNVNRPITEQECLEMIGNEETAPDFDNFANLSATAEQYWGQDRAAMERGHFTGFTRNLIIEDVVVQASMGAVRDRTQDFLSATDIAIVRARRLLLEALAADGAGTYRRPPLPHGGNDWFPLDAVLPAGTDWRHRATPRQAAE